MLLVSSFAEARPGKGGNDNHGKRGNEKNSLESVSVESDSVESDSVESESIEDSDEMDRIHFNFNIYNSTCLTNKKCDSKGKSGLICIEGFCL